MSNYPYQRYNHRKGRWERRMPRNRYRNTYITYPQSSGRRGGGAGLFGAIVIILFVGANVFSFCMWYFR